MKKPETICAFCNRSQGADKLTEALRGLHPEAFVIACLPQDHPTVEETKKYVDEVICEVPASGAAIRLLGLFRLARRLRARKIDLLILQFESVKLRLLAAVIAPAKCWAWLVSGRAFELPTSITGTLGQLLVLRTRFYGRMLRLVCFTYLVRIRPQAPRRPR